MKALRPVLDPRMQRHVLAGAAMSLLLACGGGSDTSPATGSPSAPRTLTGAMSTTVYYGTTETRTPYDLSASSVSALVPESGSYRTIPGTTRADGTFSIPDVPGGGVWLRFDDSGTGSPEFYWTESSQMDLNWASLGNPSVPRSSSTGTTTITVDPAAPGMTVASQDILSPMAGYAASLTTSSSWPSTSFSWRGKPLLSTSRETDLIITGLTSGITTAGDTYRWITGYSKSGISAFTMQEGLSNTVQANLTIQATPSSAWARINRDAFTAGTFTGGTLANPLLTTEYRAQFLGGSRGPIGGAQARLLTHTTSTLTGTLDTGTLAYGDPFPTDWTRLIRIAYTTLAGPFTFGTGLDTYSVRFQVGTSSNWRADAPPSSNPITPLVGPVGNLQVNGQSAMTPRTGVGTTPTLSWTAPAMGSATSYSVLFIDMDTDQDLAYFITPNTSLQLPSGILPSGHRCMVVVMAYHKGGGYDGARPYASGWPYGYATMVSEPFVP